jgi:hypothetical protein
MITLEETVRLLEQLESLDPRHRTRGGEEMTTKASSWHLYLRTFTYQEVSQTITRWYSQSEAPRLDVGSLQSRISGLRMASTAPDDARSLPECSECAQPYKRSTATSGVYACVNCGVALVLVQHTITSNGTDPRSKCLDCGRLVIPGKFRFCLCGSELPKDRISVPPRQHSSNPTNITQDIQTLIGEQL